MRYIRQGLNRQLLYDHSSTIYLYDFTCAESGILGRRAKPLAGRVVNSDGVAYIRFPKHEAEGVKSRARGL
jgi:hypothetical protein